MLPRSERHLQVTYKTPKGEVAENSPVVFDSSPENS